MMPDNYKKTEDGSLYQNVIEDITGEEIRHGARIAGAGVGIEERHREKFGDKLETVALRLEYDEEDPEIRRERIGRELQSLESGADVEIWDYDPEKPYNNNELTRKENGIALEVVSADRSNVLDFIHGTDFYVDE